MVFVQLVAFGRVQGNRVTRKKIKAERMERERLRREKLLALEEKKRLGGGDGVCEVLQVAECNGLGNGNANGGVKENGKLMNGKIYVPGIANGMMETDTEESMTETSEEEMFI